MKRTGDGLRAAGARAVCGGGRSALLAVGMVVCACGAARANEGAGGRTAGVAGAGEGSAANGAGAVGRVAETSAGGEAARGRALTDALHAGAWAIQFGINRDFTLRDFGGAVISIKRQHSRRTAFRLTLDVFASDSHNKTAVTVTGTDSVFSSSRSEANNREGGRFSVGLQWMRYLQPSARTAAFFAVGPAGGYARFDSNGRGFFGKETGWHVGVRAGFGVEWFAARTVSLHAEYRVSALRTSTRETRTSRSTGRVSVDTRTNTSTEFSADSVLFGLSVYF